MTLHTRRAFALACLALTTSASHAQSAAAPRVRLATSLGDVVVQLDAQRAPKTVENFLRYVRDKHYDGTIFHRVIRDFMIQGGGFSADMTQKPTRAPIVNEARNGLKNQRYTIAMARTQQPDSASAQFFINVVDNPGLDAPNPDGHGYAVFGRVVEGQAVVEQIRNVPTAALSPVVRDVPVNAVVIFSATLVN